MNVLSRLLNRKDRAMPAAPIPAPAESQAPPPAPEPPAKRPFVVTEETLGLGDEIPRTRLPDREPAQRLTTIGPEERVDPKQLEAYRALPAYRNFLEKAKRPPVRGARRFTIPEEYGGGPRRRPRI